MKKEGYKTSVLGKPIYRKQVGNGEAYHYTTCIARNYQIIDGFSPTDCWYIQQAGITEKMTLRIPKLSSLAMPIFIIDEFKVTPMVADILTCDDEVTKFYLKPLGLKKEDVVVVDGTPLEEWTHNHFPYIRDATEYMGERPDCTLIIYDRRGKHVVDVFGKYYVYVDVVKRAFDTLRRPAFIGYVKDLGLPVKTKVVKIDEWRSRTKIELESTDEWVRLTDSEWLGAWTESERKFKRLVDSLLAELNRSCSPYEGVIVSLSYSSNLFVNYGDVLVKIKDEEIREQVKEKWSYAISKIRELQVEEIVKNVFHV